MKYETLPLHNIQHKSTDPFQLMFSNSAQ